ncbi:hypothetical protein [Xanthomonas vesicatoria]|uniref:Uncharacterized protein n=3 Tax=Xanthomonas vesicatoria TaxID=56460 RepID=A0ABS8LDH6_9XANT|nr:hypothetical protein [Xanthomonas vesicatoria]MCC8598223.1 hypothetical protein [Xanthomonas vesicatoria]MCC8607614.1 hypothetical protein [Xanthomonas vesicatoria]MCC8619054.1 hypothetical protein [Xanthomonas vesicatoria]MCC8623813.1 hypothetical protein [Xanthomonas vesicatoria]MCC8632637.1 hypothetical protein [Xanthomonas vesicatoria]
MNPLINIKQSLYMRWYEEYRERRYLHGVPDDIVAQRARDLISNILTLEPNGKIGCVQGDAQTGNFLWRLFSHILEESRLRTGSHQGIFIRCGLKDTPTPKPTTPNSPASAAILRLQKNKPKERYLYKFGESKWMQALLERGEIRIAPASLYNDDSLGAAIADDELSYDLETSAFEDDILSLNPFKTRLIDTFGPPASKPQKVVMETNYYVWCASFGLNLRLFDDFNADSVLVIRNVGEFSRRLLKALQPHLHSWRFAPCAVHYFDPYHPSRKTQSVFTCKHFKYLYQEELRYVFLPPTPTKNLTPLFLKLGPLNDIAELIYRNGLKPS